jgi:hypothetical protein
VRKWCLQTPTLATLPAPKVWLSYVTVPVVCCSNASSSASSGASGRAGGTRRDERRDRGGWRRAWVVAASAVSTVLRRLKTTLHGTSGFMVVTLGGLQAGLEQL